MLLTCGRKTGHGLEGRDHMLATICKLSLEKQLQACYVPKTAARPLTPLPPLRLRCFLPLPCVLPTSFTSLSYTHTTRKSPPTRPLELPLLSQ